MVHRLSTWLRRKCRFVILAAAAVLLGCQPSAEPSAGSEPELVVAAAANLTPAFREIGEAFTAETGIPVIYNFGATTQLMQQIENGAPFDVFAAGDTFHVDKLVQSGKVLPDSRAVYGRGRLALWVPDNSRLRIRRLSDLQQPAVRYIAIANPDIAPYGAATVEVLKRQGLWQQLEPRMVRAENVNAALQLAATGNAEAVFTAYSLLLEASGAVILIEEDSHFPIEQALGVVAGTSSAEQARRFAAFVLGPQGRVTLEHFGYLPPQRP